MTLTFELDPDSVKQNQRAKYVRGHVDQSYRPHPHPTDCSTWTTRVVGKYMSDSEPPVSVLIVMRMLFDLQCAMPCDVTAQHCDVICSSTPHVSTLVCIHSLGLAHVFLLHFAWVVDDAKCIVVTSVCVSVCLSAAVRPHYCTDPDVTWGRGRGCRLIVHCWTDLQSAHGCVAMAT